MKTLTLDEMLWALKTLEPDTAERYQTIMEGLGSAMAAHIGITLNVGYTAAKAEEPEFGGTCARFHARHAGQRCPDVLKAYDETEWTDRHGAEIEPVTDEPDADAPDQCACQNCDWTGPADATIYIEDIFTRVSPGEVMPSGECPACGALCHPVAGRAVQ